MIPLTQATQGLEKVETLSQRLAMTLGLTPSNELIAQRRKSLRGFGLGDCEGPFGIAHRFN